MNAAHETPAVLKLCREADALCSAAKRAEAAGDMEAFVQLIMAASQCTRAARALDDMNKAAGRAALAARTSDGGEG